MTPDNSAACVPNVRFPEFHITGNWKRDQIGSIATISKGKGVSKADIVKDGLTPCVRYAELYTHYGEVIREVLSHTNVATEELVLSHTEDVIVPSSGETRADIARAACVVPAGVALGGDLNILRSDLSGRFFSYLLNSPLRYAIARLAQGDTVAHLYPGQLAKIMIAYPLSAEQQKIANCFGVLDDLITAEGRRLEALRQHKQGLMQQLFPQPGQTAPRLRFPEFKAAVWESKTLDTLVSNTERPIVMDDETEYALVTVKRRYGGVVTRRILKGKAISVKSQFLIEEDDFLISKRQIVHNACGLVPTVLAGSIVSNEYSVLTAKNGCDINFFNYFVKQPCVSESFLQTSVGIVIEKMLFKLDWWLKLAFPFPSSAEQKRIADCLSSLDARLTAQVQKLNVLKAHKQGLLQQLFPRLEDQEL